MFCIAAFIVLAIIGIFSATHRKLARKAWSCTLRRVTFRPCDTSFKEDAKSKLLSHVAKRTPRLIKAADVAIEVSSFLLVIMTVWSLFSVINSGLNLYVWGTCNPSNASSCSLTSEACSIDTAQQSLWDLTIQGKPWVWFVNEAGSFINTVTNIPTRMQSWDANDYLPQNPTYYYAKDNTKPTALEVIDPGCRFCASLFKNIKSAKFEDNYNLTYIAFPIKNPTEEGKYKFPNSYTVTRYLESVKLNPLISLKTPADWQILERIYTWNDKDGLPYQARINSFLNQTQTEELIKEWLSDLGYSSEQIKLVDSDAKSSEVADIIKQNQQIVTSRIKTVKIPTIIFSGQRRDGAIKVLDLR